MKQSTTLLRKIASLGFVSALVTGLLAGATTTPALAANTAKMVVKANIKQTTTGLNMRSGAATSYKIITVLKKGEKVTVKSTSGAWSKVVSAKHTGWVSSKYLKPAAASAPSPGPTAAKINLSFTAAGVTSKFHVFPVTAAKGILFYLDGDGQWAFDNASSSYALGGSNGIVEQARKRGYMTVAVRTPDRQGTPTWWEDGAKNSVYFDALRNEIGKQYPGAKENWLTGYSGGAQFLTQSYLPQHPEAMLAGGGAVMMGGGGTPELKVKGFTKAQTDAFTMHWYTGAADIAANSDENYDALGEAKAGKAWYAKAGFRTSSSYPKGVDHDLSGRFGSAIGTALDR